MHPPRAIFLVVFILGISFCLNQAQTDEELEAVKEAMNEACGKKDSGLGQAFSDCLKRFPLKVQNVTKECSKQALSREAQLEDVFDEACKNQEIELLSKVGECMQEKFNSDSRYRTAIATNMAKIVQGRRCVRNAFQSNGARKILKFL